MSARWNPLAALLHGLRAALRRDGRWADADFTVLPDHGLAHVHVRLVGTGCLARIPKQSQVGLGPAANLAHQQACFERAWPSGHAPRWLATLAPEGDLPRGALIVEEIVGSPASLPRDLGAIARALAAIHALPLPHTDRAPLQHARDPLHELALEISVQAGHMQQVHLASDTRRVIEEGLRALRQDVESVDRPPLGLIAFDAHPGNFLVRADGEAVLVDLEKCRYSHPGLDLAHATLYTSTTWDLESAAELSAETVADFYRQWEHAMPDPVARLARPWHLRLRRAMWLWSLTWCCKWRALSDAPAQSADAGEDWSRAHSDAALIEHVRERVTHYLSPVGVERVLEELRELDRMLAE